MFSEALRTGLADYHVASAVVLTIALVATGLLRQPTRRLVIAWAGVVALTALLPLSTLPDWSLFHFGGAAPVTAAPAPDAAPRGDAFVVGAAPAPIASNTATPVATPAPAFDWWDWSVELLTSAYALGSLMSALWIAWGAVAAHRLIRAATPASAAAVHALEQLAAPAAPPRLLATDQLETAAAFGLLRPTILLPQQALRDESPDELRAVLAHELAHVRGGDLWLLAALRGLLVVLWCNPLYWLLRRRVRLDQETLADAAASELSDRQAYAERLLAWARSAASPPRLAGAAGLWESPSQLRKRIAALLDESFTVARRSTWRWRTACGVACGVVAIGLSLVTLSPAQTDVAEADQQASEQPAAPEGDEGNRYLPRIPTTPSSRPAETRPDLPNVARGVCVDEAGQPVVGATILIHRLKPNESVFERIHTTTTDEAGEFRIDNVVTEELAKERDPRFGPIALLILSAQKPGLASQMASDPIERIANDGVHARFTLRPAATVRGRVVGPDGKPVEGAFVRAERLGIPIPTDGVLFSAVTDAEGRYAIDDLPIADFVAEMEAQAESERRQREQAETQGQDWVLSITTPTILNVSHPDYAITKSVLAEAPSEVDIRMLPAATVTGQVVDDEGRGVAGVRVALGATLNGSGVTNAERIARAYSAVNRTDAQGKYRFDNAPEGEYLVYVIYGPGDQENASTLLPPAGVQFNAIASDGLSTAPILKMTSGRVVSIQLVDKATGEPLSFDEPMRAGVYFVAKEQPTAPTGVDAKPIQESGRFTMRIFNGAGDLYVQTLVTADGADGPPVWEPDQSVAVAALSDNDEQPIRYPVTLRSVLLTERASKLFASGDVDAAIELLNRAVTEGPGNLDVLAKRAEIAQRSGRNAMAIADLETLVRAGVANRWMYLNNLAHLLATAGDTNRLDPKRALELAEQAIQLAPRRYSQLLDTLATAQAANGDFAAAAKSQQEAIKLAPESERAELRKRLEAYQQGRTQPAEASADAP